MSKIAYERLPKVVLAEAGSGFTIVTSRLRSVPVGPHHSWTHGGADRRILVAGRWRAVRFEFEMTWVALGEAATPNQGSHPRRCTVELASQELIDSLLLHAAHARPARVSRNGIRPAGSQLENRVAGRRRPRCRCGRCRQCLESARWERIFAEKFADPDYYTRLQVRRSSPLESL
jgi:hypothetical protein